jgi:hypothetical protein
MCLLELLGLFGGVPELLAPSEVTLMGRFLTTGESLLPVGFSAVSHWLELPAPLLVCPDFWIPTEGDQHSDKALVLLGSF